MASSPRACCAMSKRPADPAHQERDRPIPPSGSPRNPFASGEPLGGLPPGLVPPRPIIARHAAGLPLTADQRTFGANQKLLQIGAVLHVHDIAEIGGDDD